MASHRRHYQQQQLENEKTSHDKTYAELFTHQYYFQISSIGPQELSESNQQDIGLNLPFVNLVDNHVRDRFEIMIVLEPAQNDPGRAKQELCVLASLGFHPNRIPDLVSQSFHGLSFVQRKPLGVGEIEL